MRTGSLFCALLVAGLCASACSSNSTSPADTGEDDSQNPFLQDQSNHGKEDTGYLNPDGIEVEVDLEADVDLGSSSWQLADAPAMLGQYALTYLRKRGEFYLESLAEDSSSDQRVEWQVDGSWITAAQASSVSKDKLKHFRIRSIDAVLLHSAAQGVKVGSVFQATVPVNPYRTMTDAADSCADPDDHMSLSQSVYWYMWNPEREGCKIATQQMNVTVSKMFSSSKTTYPEYDKLTEDGKVTAVVLFGQIGDGEITDRDPGMVAFRQMTSWLTRAQFKEVTPAPVGRRFTKHIGSVDFEIDLYSPHEFSGLDDMGHFANFQKALSEHEIVTYDGHSMLGASDFWSKPQYPSFYQIYLYGGCLGYEYYVKPILHGKGGWSNLDIMSSVVEVSANANEFAGPFLAKFAWALENGYAASWKDMLVAVRKSVGDSTFGASGVRDNCFSPAGSLCAAPPEPGQSGAYKNDANASIPDNSRTGISSVIEVPESFTAKTVQLDLNITHSWVGDLQITLEHNGQKATIWNKAGGSAHDIVQSFTVGKLAGAQASGKWTLQVIDTAQGDTGTLNSWSLLMQK